MIRHFRLFKDSARLIGAIALLFIHLFFLSVSSFADGSVVSFQGHTFTVYRVNLAQQELELISRDSTGNNIFNAGTLEARAKRDGQQLLFATNAGIFDRSFSPLGLHVEKGHQIIPLNTANGAGNFYLKPNGVFSVTGQCASIVETGKFDTAAKVELATQSGPLLLQAGSVNPLFNPTSANRLKRSGVGLRIDSEILFVISDDAVSFFEFASFFRDQLKCHSALYLDGVISAMYVADLKRREIEGSFAAMLAVFGR